MIHSKNGTKYAQFDFSAFNERGLKPFLSQMKKAGSTVVDISATNKQRRVNGLPQKMAVLHLENGQTVTLRVGSSGDLVEVKLNTQKIPIKNKETLRGIAKDIASAAARNQARFDKSQAKKLAKLKVDTGATGKKSSGNSLNDLKSRLETRRKETESLTAQRDNLNTQITELTAQIAEQKTTNSTLQAEEEQLQGQLDALESQNG